MASLMNGLHCQEEKGKKGAWEPSEDQYVRTGEPPSHAKTPVEPQPLLAACSAVSRIRETNLWE